MLRPPKTEVVIIEYDRPLRTYLRLLLSHAGYVVTPLTTFEDAICHLRSSPAHAVVIASNVLPDNSLVAAFFARVMEDHDLSTRHRYLLLTTTPEQLPAMLRTHLARLGATEIKKPFPQQELLSSVESEARLLRHIEEAELSDLSSGASHSLESSDDPHRVLTTEAMPDVQPASVP